MDSINVTAVPLGVIYEKIFHFLGRLPSILNTKYMNKASGPKHTVHCNVLTAIYSKLCPRFWTFPGFVPTTGPRSCVTCVDCNINCVCYVRPASTQK